MSDHSGAAERTRFVVTSNRGFAAYAQDELRSLVPGTKFEELIPKETYLMNMPLGRAEALETVRAREPIFVRHLHPVDRTVPTDGSGRDIDAISRAAADLFGDGGQGEAVAVQIRKSDGHEGEYAPSELREAIADKLRGERGARLVVKDAARVVSVFLSPGTAYVGLSTAEQNLSDWPGGAIRFRKEEGQVSRAKFKLLEAEIEFGLDLSRYSRALDIGAAPGGWTSLLLERGAEVTAVDPADLHPSLLGHPKLTYLKRNAGDVSFRPGSYDLLVCDMSWSPKMMVRLVVPLLDALREGGDAIITLKLKHGKPFQTVKDSVRAMQHAMELRKAKQLFHNRDELTLHLRKRPNAPNVASGGTTDHRGAR